MRRKVRDNAAGDVARVEALLRAGRAGEAVRLAESALGNGRRDGGLLRALGMARGMVGDTGGAIEALEQSLEIQPRDVLALSQLSNALRMDERLEAALGSAERALAVDGTHPMALSAAAELLVMLDRAGEARGLLEAVVERGAARGPVGVAWGKVMLATGEAERGIEVVRAVCDDEREIEDARSGAVFVLGNLLLRCGRDDAAFEAFARANAMRGGARGAGDSIRMMQRLGQAWTPTAVESLRTKLDGADALGEGLVFVVGMPRSGTTLVERILDAHPGAVGVGEAQVVGRAAGELAREGGSGGGEVHPVLLGVRGLREKGEAVVGALRARAVVAGEIVVDKQPMNFLHVGLLLVMLPGARIVHCVRDARDTCVSCFTQDFGAGLAFTQDLAVLGRFYRVYEQLMAHWRNTLGIEMLEVRYEELVERPEEKMRELVGYVGLEWDERCARFHESGRASSTASNEQVRRPINAASVGRWKRFEKHLGPLTDALEGDG